MNQTMLNGLLTKLFKGDEETKTKTIRDATIESLYYLVDEYCSWAVEQGTYLPPGYETDPTSWSEVLNSIKRAFRLLFEEMNNEGELWEAKSGGGEYTGQDTEKVEKLEKEIQEGLAHFGKYLFYLQDRVVDRGPSHG